MYPTNPKTMVLFRIKSFFIVLFLLPVFSGCTGVRIGMGPIVVGPVFDPGLSEADVAAGLREALVSGASFAVTSAGKENGFLNNVEIRIPFPEEAIKVKEFAVNNGMQSLSNAFEAKLNSTAELASKEALDILKNAVLQMSIQDAFAILRGGDNAATRYLQIHTEEEILSRFRPVVESAIKTSGLTAAWEPLATAYNASVLFTGGNAISTDLPDYVCRKATDGLFYLIALEEAKVRKDPMARTTELMQRVFAAQ